MCGHAAIRQYSYTIIGNIGAAAAAGSSTTARLSKVVVVVLVVCVFALLLCRVNNMHTHAFVCRKRVNM